MSYCCGLGAVIEEERVLCTTDNFFVVPTIGSMGVEGYLLIVPYKHYEAMAEVPQQKELSELYSDVVNLVSSEYSSPLVFEHGPRINQNAGKSMGHAHLHVVPGVDITREWAVDLIYRLEQEGDYYKLQRVQDLSEGKKLLDSGSSYLYMRNPQGVQLMSEQSFDKPMFYFRSMVAEKIGVSDPNWKTNPCYETLEKTVERLKGKL